MIVPGARWLWGLALLSLVALPSAWLGAGVTLLLVVDVIWLAALAVDGWRCGDLGADDLVVRREAPPALSRGREAAVSYRWLNPLGRTIVVEAREEMPAQLALVHERERRLTLPPNGAVREEVEVRAVRRGRVSGGRLHMRVRGPWGLAWRHLRIDAPWKTTVFPDLSGTLTRILPAQTRRRKEAGLRNVRRLGEGRLFESLREWVPGDDTRTIDWKATARRGKPIARQYEDERRQQVLLVLDAGRMLTVEVDGRALVEFAIDAAVQLAASAVEHDDNVGVMIFADGIQHHVAPARGRRALRRIVDALAAAEARMVEPDYPAVFAHLAAHNRKRALTVLFTDVIDRTASEALLAHIGSLRPRHLPLAVVLRNPELNALAVGGGRPVDVSAAFERAAAEDLLQAREAALAEMRERGVLVLDVAPGAAAREVVDQYARLKRRGML
ncbi:MAG: DUF58 domain-containing protein [Gemmatimonadota bacterium]